MNSAALAAVLYVLTAKATSLPMQMTFTRGLLIFVLTVTMCSFSGLVAMRKLKQSDPGHLRVAPQLVLADEPTSALDSKTGREVIDLLVQLAREDRCPILMVTHDTRIADMADRIISMEDGRIISS